jgi:hypothetical protein
MPPKPRPVRAGWGDADEVQVRDAVFQRVATATMMREADGRWEPDGDLTCMVRWPVSVLCLFDDESASCREAWDLKDVDIAPAEDDATVLTLSSRSSTPFGRLRASDSFEATSWREALSGHIPMDSDEGGCASGYE